MGWGQLTKPASGTLTPQQRYMRSFSEADWQTTVLEIAVLHGWSWFHDQDSRRNEAGLPDLFLRRGTELIVAELKTETGKVTPEQGAWLSCFEANGIATYVWRPRDLPELKERLARRRPQ